MDSIDKIQCLFYFIARYYGKNVINKSSPKLYFCGTSFKYIFFYFLHGYLCKDTRYTAAHRCAVYLLVDLIIILEDG